MHPPEKIAEYLEGIRSVIGNCVKAMPTHDEYIAKRCAASPEPQAA
jgi:tryptophan halogenase